MALNILTKIIAAKVAINKIKLNIDFLSFFANFLKIGVVSFGGGYGMIPLIQETVVTKGWLSQEQILNFIAVSESTPGPIAINMATFIGSSQGGIFVHPYLCKTNLSFHLKQFHCYLQ